MGNPTSHLVLLLAFLMPCMLAVHAKTFTVSIDNRLPDSSPGDGICRTSNFRCSLRAAIEEANARPNRDKVVIPSGTYHTDIGASGIPIRESITITSSGATPTISGSENERNFDIRNEKLLFGLSNAAIGAFRPSSGRRLNPVVGSGGVSATPGSIFVDGDNLFVTFFTEGVARYTLRSRETIERSSSKSTYAFDRLVINDNGNGAGLTAPTTVATTSDGDLLVNSFQPTGFGIRRYDSVTFAYKGIFINPPGIVNTMVRSGSRLYVTLVNSNQVRTYDAASGAVLKTSSTFLNTPRGITLCSGRVFVADEKNNRVVELNSDLGFVRVIVQDSGRLETPQALACFSGGDLFIKTKNRKLLQYTVGTTSSTFVRDLTISGTFIGGIASITNKDHADGPRVTIKGLTLQDGRVSTGQNGPSISAGRGTSVKIERCTIRKNQGSVFGGAVTNSGTMKIVRCRLIDNTMPKGTLEGGGVTNSGGAIGNFGKLSIKASELANNQAARGGAIWNSGSEAFLSVFGSTISNNFAGNAGGGIWNTRFVELKYSTITENTCGQFSGDPASRRAGCGFYSFRNPSTPNSFVTISSSVIANNEQVGNLATFAPDCLAETVSSVRTFGGNIIGAVDNTVCKIFGSVALDRRGSRTTPVDPGLGPLQFLSISGRVGQSTQSSFTRGHNPKSGSLAVSFNPFGTGGNPTDKCPKKDQIGRRRPQGSVCDVGAIERETQSFTTLQT